MSFNCLWYSSLPWQRTYPHSKILKIFRIELTTGAVIVITQIFNIIHPKKGTGYPSKMNV